MTDIFFRDLEQAAKEGLLRRLKTVDSAQGRRVSIDGRDILLFCSNNYLGLADHPTIKKAAIDCIKKYGVGAGASRLVSGNMAPHRELEEKIARFCKKESAITFNSGYQANVGTLTALLGKGDVVFADRLCHASILDGVRWSGARLKRFRHNDPDSLESLLKKEDARGKKLIVTEGVFSMDGDKAPLKEVADLAKRFQALFMLDDAHGFGLFGDKGRGTADDAGIVDRVDILVVTLGKALGGAGGVILGSKSLVTGLINFARSFMFSTAIPPSLAAAGAAAIDIIEGEQGAKRRNTLFNSATVIRKNLVDLGYDTGASTTQIIPIFTGEEDKALKMSAKLMENGAFIPAIRYPTVPKGEARLRLTLTADHSSKDLEHLIKIFGIIKN
ncbi:8-amino-7-oxononanoate synthase [hydrothermal vent metagenome]|uniref:8-amino-7-oxononanoate synthase n=1 Tax=hydrothermal vent metagenome TaxID=652676 RepID=A0A3B1D0L2_9ZZZZ